MKFSPTLLVAAIFSISFSAYSVELTSAQKAIIKSNAESTPTTQTCISQGNDGCVVDYYNSSSSVVVWRTSVPLTEIYKASTFNWTLVDGLTVGKRDEWTWLFNSGSYNAANINERAAVTDVWSGTGAKDAVQAGIFTISKRFATNLEALFATGSGTTLSPSTLVIEGSLGYDQIGNILRP